MNSLKLIHTMIAYFKMLDGQCYFKEDIQFLDDMPLFALFRSTKVWIEKEDGTVFIFKNRNSNLRDFADPEEFFLVKMRSEPAP